MRHVYGGSLQSLTVHGTNMRPGRDAIHPCAFQRGSFATTCLTSLQLTDCNFDVIPFQVCRSFTRSVNHYFIVTARGKQNMLQETMLDLFCVAGHLLQIDLLLLQLLIVQQELKAVLCCAYGLHLSRTKGSLGYILSMAC